MAKAKKGTTKAKAKTKAKPTAKPKAPRRAKAAPALLQNADLEAAIVADPYDDHAWSVLEDWLLEQNDPRAPIVLADRAKEESEAKAARKKIARLLFGANSVKLGKRVEYVTTWRAGHLVEAHFMKPYKHELAAELVLVEELLASPAARLLRRFSCGIKEVAERRHLQTLAEIVARSPCRALRSLEIGYGDPYESYRQPFDAAWLAPLALHELELYGTVALQYAPNLAKLRTLKLELPSAGGADLAALFRGNLFDELRTLDVPVDKLMSPSFGLDRPKRLQTEALEPLLAATSTPKLEALYLYDPYNETTAALVETLAPSQLLRQLKTLKLGYRLGVSHPEMETERVVPGSALGPAFAHLEMLTVPARYKL